MSKKKHKKPNEKDGFKTNGSVGKTVSQKNRWFAHKNINFFLITGFVLILYMNSVPNEFSLDDEFVSQNNSLVKQGIKAIPEIFVSLYADEGKKSYGYRPVVQATFAIEHSLFNGNPHISHFINVLLYLLICLLMYKLLSKCLSKYHSFFPLAIVLLFAAHPLHTEVVSSLKNRDEMLSLLGGLLSLAFMVKYVEQRKVYFLPIAILFFLFGFLSKASVLSFVVIIPLCIYFFTDFKVKDLILIFTLLVIFAIIAKYAPSRLYLPDRIRPKFFIENPLLFERGFATRISTGFFILLYYIKMLLIPYPLIHYYGYNMIPIVGFNNIWVIISIIVHFALFGFAIYKIRSKNIWSFAILYYLISVSMFSNILKPAMGIVAERFLFIPSIGFCILIVLVLFKVFKINELLKKVDVKKMKSMRYSLIAILIIYSMITIGRNPDWKDLMTLLQSDIEKCEQSAKVNSMYGGELLGNVMDKVKAGQSSQLYANEIRESEKYLLHSLEIYPEIYSSLNNLGSIYFTFYKDYDKSFEYLEKAVLINRSKPEEAYYNLGVNYLTVKKYKEAEENFGKALRLKPNFTEALEKLGELYVEKGEIEKGIEMNEKIMEIIPNSDVPYLKISKIYLGINDTISAIGYMEKAIEKEPRNKALINSLIQYFLVKGDIEKANYYKGLGRGL